jgi:Ca2+-transporting ATPase
MALATAARGDPLSGLDTEEALRRLADLGPNIVAARRRISPIASTLTQLRDPLMLVLLAAAVLTLATSDLTDAAVILIVVVVNTAVGVTQELRADRAIAALSALSAPKVRVRRDGHDAELAAADIVPGDVLILGEGDIVPADSAVLEAQALLVDEAALTGESVPVGKTADSSEHSELSAGTVVVKGRAIAVATATGADSSLGRIAALLDTALQATPLQRKLAALGRVLAAAAIALSAVVLALGLVRGEPLERMALTAISLAVAAVPESLPAVVTLSLALGARQMARRRAIVRRLAAVETLGSVTVLATDKTGTLTTGRMRAELAWTRDGEAPLGDERSDVGGQAVVELLNAVVLCNDASWQGGAIGAIQTGLGDPTEVALLMAGFDAGLERASLALRYPRVAEVPFDSVSQRMATVHRDGDGFLVCVKGAPEAVVSHLGWQPEDADFAKQATRRADELAAAGYRVLAVATGWVDVLPDDLTKVEAGLRLQGLVAIADPPKPGAYAAIEACQRAGIVPILITGDHAATAAAIATRVGIVTAPFATDSVVTGDQLRRGGVKDLTQTRVFARIAPEQKLEIVEAWRQGGAIVAMVGDGVNDGPALRRADIGVAMGHRGTEVARQAADLVLADDDLGTVVAAVEEGRRIYANVRRFLTFGLAGGAAEILLMLVGPFVGLKLPLLAGQILWINLLTHGLTGVALGAEPTEPSTMTRPPRDPNESVLGDGLWLRVLRLAVVVTATTLAVALWAHGSGREWQSMLFISLTMLQLGVAVGLRAKSSGGTNPFLPVAIAASAGLALAGIYVPVLRHLLETASLPWRDAAIAVSVGIVGWIAVRIEVRFSQRPTSPAVVD